MLNTRTSRIIGFAAILVITAITLMICQYADRQFCMGVQLIDQEELNQYQEGWFVNPEEITFCGEKAPIDTASNKIYITQPASVPDHFSDLKGILTSKNRYQILYFIRDEAILNPGKAMRENIPLSLVVVQDGYYCRMKVVLTSLPVINLYGVDSDRTDEKGRVIKTGHVTVFSANEEGSDYISAKSSPLEFHVRGLTSSHSQKNPWKLSLKDSRGEKQNEDFLGLGEDDDWILNSMIMDDTKIKEKFMIDTWNQYVSTSDDAYKMSAAEYVEVILNGGYRGLHLLQRRVDEKYLELETEDMLFKGRNTYQIEQYTDEYDTIYSPFDEKKTREIFDDVLKTSRLNAESFMKTDLYLHFFHAMDNTGNKNMFYVLKDTTQGYEMHLLPWDTDMSLGVVASGGFVYDYEKSIKGNRHRREYQAVRAQTPTFDTQYQERWHELRQTAFSPERMESHIRGLQEQIEGSGAYQRDQYHWGVRYEGKDTCDELIRWCKERTKIFDLEYGSK